MAAPLVSWSAPYREARDEPSADASSALTSFVVASRYVPVYIALFLLVIVAGHLGSGKFLSRVALRAIAPYGAVLGITALGQMLVIVMDTSASPGTRAWRP